MSVGNSRQYDGEDVDVTGAVTAAAIEVHKVAGPGLLESAYQKLFGRELDIRGIPYLREVPVDVHYKGLVVEAGYFLDFLVEGRVIVELKSVEAIAPVHEAQLLTYFRLTGHRVGLLINFNVPRLKDGIKRRVI